MILDRLAHAAAYRRLSPSLAKAFDYLEATDFTGLADGRHDIDGDRVFAIVQHNRTKAPAVAIWEAHRKYIDVQYMVEGTERMGYLPLDKAIVSTPYDAEKDAAFYKPGNDLIEVGAGSFAVFGPQDVHAPGLVAGSPATPAEVVKVVVKVAVDPEAGPAGF